jgi:hypothetical protein
VNGYSGGQARTKRIRLTAADPFPENTSANFYWRADDLIFIAKGEAPYIIAYGNIAEKNNAGAGYRELAKRADEASRVNEMGAEFVLAGEKALIPTPEETHTARKVVLIAFMFAVVIFVSGAAVRLLIKGNNKA